MATRIYSRFGSNVHARTGAFDLSSVRSTDMANDMLEVAHGVYRVGDAVTITFINRNGVKFDIESTFAGYERSTLYPVFYFDVWDRTTITYRNGSVIGTDEPQSRTTTYRVTDFVTDTPLGIGTVTFADYGLRVGETDDFNS